MQRKRWTVKLYNSHQNTVFPNVAVALYILLTSVISVPLNEKWSSQITCKHLQAGWRSIQWIGYWLDDLGFKSQHRQEILLFSKASKTGSGAHPVSYSVGFFPGGRWTECKADHLPPPSVTVKNEWCYTVTSPLCLHSMHKTWQHPCHRKGCLDIKKFQVGIKLPRESQAEILPRFCQHGRQCSYVHLNLDKDIPLCWRLCHSVVQIFY